MFALFFITANCDGEYISTTYISMYHETMPPCSKVPEQESLLVVALSGLNP